MHAQPALRLDAITIEGLEIAAKTLGCALFLDLTWYADDANGNQAARSLLDTEVNPAQSAAL